MQMPVRLLPENVAEVVRKHQLDGLDLDFEWIDQNDTAAWNNYGELARAIRAASPDMFFTISLHTYYYKFPAACHALCGLFHVPELWPPD